MEELDKLSFADVAEASTKSPTIAKDGRYSSFIGFFSCALVAGFNSRKNFFNRCPHVRALAGIAQTMLFGLTCTLTC